MGDDVVEILTFADLDSTLFLLANTQRCSFDKFLGSVCNKEGIFIQPMCR